MGQLYGQGVWQGRAILDCPRVNSGRWIGCPPRSPQRLPGAGRDLRQAATRRHLSKRQMRPQGRGLAVSAMPTLAVDPVRRIRSGSRSGDGMTILGRAAAQILRCSAHAAGSPRGGGRKVQTRAQGWRGGCGQLLRCSAPAAGSTKESRRRKQKWCLWRDSNPHTLANSRF